MSPRFADRRRADAERWEAEHLAPAAARSTESRGRLVAEPPDVEEVLEIQRRFALRPESILLMPQGGKREELIERSRWVWEACRDHSFRFSPRLHILIWGAQRGR